MILSENDFSTEIRNVAAFQLRHFAGTSVHATITVFAKLMWYLLIVNQEGHGRLNSVDFISQLSDDVLVKILSLLPLKDAGATNILSPRWRLMWCSLTQLDFDGYKIPDKMANDHNLLVLERKKFVSQSNCNEIDYWLRFAQGKKVDKLDLDLWDYNHKDRDPSKNYEFPLPSSDGNMIHLVEWPLSDPVVAEMKSLKEICLSSVNISEPTLLGLLKSSPHLETLNISDSCMLTHIHVGGRNLNLKHFNLSDCPQVKSISLYNFDLVTFIYEGPEINLLLTGLPMLKKFEFCEDGVGLKNSILNQISTVASNLHVLYLDIHCPKVSYNVNSIPKLPNVKRLVLRIGAEEDDSLLEFTSIAKACPRLEKFKIV
ncbi:F-box domain containing protein, partial [Tanacetum coccineum]